MINNDGWVDDKWMEDKYLLRSFRPVESAEKYEKEGGLQHHADGQSRPQT